MENKMVKIICDTKKFDELLLDVINQACGSQKFKGNKPIGEPIIDNQCLSAYEVACDYLTEQGYLYTDNGRIYMFKKKATADNNDLKKDCSTCRFEHDCDIQQDSRDGCKYWQSNPSLES